LLPKTPKPHEICFYIEYKSKMSKTTTQDTKDKTRVPQINLNRILKNEA